MNCVFKNDVFCIKNDEMCIENDETFIKMMNNCKSLNYDFGDDGKKCAECGHGKMNHYCWWNKHIANPIKVCIQRHEFCINNDGLCIFY